MSALKKEFYVTLFKWNQVKHFHHWASDCKDWIGWIKTQLLFISRIAPQKAITLLQEWHSNLWNSSSFDNEKEC